MDKQATIHIDIVSAEAKLFSGEAVMVFAPAALGEVGIAPGHTALLSTLAHGVIRVQLVDKTEEVFYVSGGILEVQPHTITVLSDTAARAADLDEAAAEEARQAAERAWSEHEAGMDYSEVLTELAQTAAQLRAIRQLRD